MAKAENNKWGFVYDGAITENVAGAVNVHPVSYLVNGVKVAANIYTPAGYDEKSDKKYPAVTVAHPNGGVKEQVSGLFAQKLAENGYIAIACDAAYQGASEGEPRNTDIPTNRVEDIHAMVDYLITFPGVDTERIGLFGICGGGGYTLKAAQTEKRAKAVATLSAFNTGIVRLYGLGNSQVDTIQQRLKEAADARTEEAKTGKVVYPAPRGQITQEYIDSLPDGLYKDGMYYYGRDYAHPNSVNKNAVIYSIAATVLVEQFPVTETVEWAALIFYYRYFPKNSISLFVSCSTNSGTK